MSGLPTKRTPLARAIRAVALALFVALAYFASRAHEAGSGGEVLLALGLFLLGGTLTAELLEPLRVPHLTGYLAVGIVSGPHVLHLVDHTTVESMTKLNALALALILNQRRLRGKSLSSSFSKRDFDRSPSPRSSKRVSCSSAPRPSLRWLDLSFRSRTAWRLLHSSEWLFCGGYSR